MIFQRRQRYGILRTDTRVITVLLFHVYQCVSLAGLVEQNLLEGIGLADHFDNRTVKGRIRIEVDQLDPGMPFN